MTENEQQPEIIITQPTIQYGNIKVRVPIKWDDFMGIEEVQKVATAMVNITMAVYESFMTKLDELGIRTTPQPPASAPEKESKKSPKESKVVKEYPDAPDFGKNITFFSTDYGWTLYCDPDLRDGIYEWIIGIPKEERRRKSADPKLPDQLDKAIWNVNETEKDLITQVAEAKGTNVTEREK